uniref:hypothetical protein ycf22 n=1 Tax=Nemalion vermiculare TaxID=935621 RepID=UPI00257A51C6|nr:hypothetical protein ycf22 [Nemalion vermiculare]WGV34379.1 hypothetical protein ycf22 [Nemalion vermiculare]
MKITLPNNQSELLKILVVLLAVLFTLLSWFVVNNQFVHRSYSVFIEFDDANGIKPGTLLRLRGLNIGSVIDVISETNSVIAIANIDSSMQIIPRNSLVETNQTGLLSDSIIDLIPLETIRLDSHRDLNPLSNRCSADYILCHLSYLQGDRGLNYDDLVRATTRISQRFDDPRFFNLFYIFLQNGIELTDNMIDILANFSYYIGSRSSQSQKHR